MLIIRNLGTAMECYIEEYLVIGLVTLICNTNIVMKIGKHLTTLSLDMKKAATMFQYS